MGMQKLICLMLQVQDRILHDLKLKVKFMNTAYIKFDRATLPSNN